MISIALTILLALIFFGVPVGYAVRKEFLLRKALGRAGGAPGLRGNDEPFKVTAFLRAFAVILTISIPIVFLSSSSYDFYGKDDSGLKIAFKHSGKRVEDCDEKDFFKKEGERYREMLKTSRQVQMNVGRPGGCSRERFPVVIELTVDNVRTLGKAYMPTGLKKDMASYISEDFIIKPGKHDIVVSMNDSGPDKKPSHTLSGSIDVKPGEIALIRFDQKTDSFVLE